MSLTLILLYFRLRLFCLYLLGFDRLLLYIFLLGLCLLSCCILARTAPFRLFLLLWRLQGILLCLLIENGIYENVLLHLLEAFYIKFFSEGTKLFDIHFSKVKNLVHKILK